MSNIPIIICNKERLSTTRRLVIDLLNLGYTNIHILDMVSTYEPLLSWYKSQEHITVHYVEENIGHKALYNTRIIEMFKNYPFVVYTDSDIQLNEHTPAGFIGQMICIAKDYRLDKVGLAIEYKSITNPVYKEIITPIESRYWQNRIPHKSLELYMAPVDTTFAVVRTDRPFTYNAIRIAGDYTCIHVPWNSNWNMIDEEERYYMTHADPDISTQVQHYNNWLHTHE